MNDWLSITEAAERLHVTAHEVLAMAVAGTLKSRLVIDHREISAAAVDAYLATQSEPRMHRDPTNPAEKALNANDEHGYDEERTK